MNVLLFKHANREMREAESTLEESATNEGPR